VKEGGRFISLILEKFPGEPAELADRIFNAAETNPDAMQIIAIYGRTLNEMAEGKIW
jgi:hypothetical protein